MSQSDASFDIRDSTFVENSAFEGGAVYAWGDVDIDVGRCAFERNRALREGGALKLRNFGSGGSELARFRMNGSALVENGAGSNLFEDRLLGKKTQGGGVLAEGSGLVLEFVDGAFRRNVASNGGALSIRAVGDCIIDQGNE